MFIFDKKFIVISSKINFCEELFFDIFIIILIVLYCVLMYTHVKYPINEI